MPEAGDFTPDGEFIYVEATNENGIKTGKLRKEKVTGLEANIFDVRKNGYRAMTAQRMRKPDPDDPIYDAIWQDGGYNILETIHPDVTLLGQTVCEVSLNDPLDDAALDAIFIAPNTVVNEMGDVTHQGSDHSRLVEWVFELSPARDAAGAVVGPAIDSRWTRFFMDTTGTAEGRVQFLIKPALEHFVWKQGDDAFDVEDHSRAIRNLTVYDYANGFVIYRVREIIRRIEWTRTGDRAQVRILFWPGALAQPVTMTVMPAGFPGNVNPTFVRTPDGRTVNLTPDPAGLGGIAITGIVVAKGTPITDASNLANTVNDLVSTVRNNEAVSTAAEGALRTAVASLRLKDSVLSSWLASITNFNGEGIYAKTADIPTDKNAGVVRTGNSAVIYIRDSAGALKTLDEYATATTAEITTAYARAYEFVANLKAAAGSPVSTAELDAIKADIDKAEADILNLAKTAGREVAEVADYVVPNPVWPAGLSNVTGGSLMVRRGQVQTVGTTTVNNVSFTGSHVIGQTFTTAERGKAMIARAAVKSASTTARIELTAQTLDGGALGQATLVYVNGAWTATSGTVTLDEGWAVLSFPVQFSASANTMIVCGITPGDVQLLALYDAASATYSKTPTDIDVTDLNTATKVRIPLNLKTQLTDHETKISAINPRLTVIEGKFNSLTTVTALGGMTRATGLPFITAPDRAGARADLLAFTFRDNRVSTSGKMDYPNRVTSVSIPMSAFNTNTPPANWAATTRTINGEVLNAFTQKFNLKDTPTGPNAFYDCWVSWRRANNATELWFESLHSNSISLGEAKDISITYVADASVVDPQLKPLQDAVDKNKADIAKNALAIADNKTRVTALEARAEVKIETAGQQLGATTLATMTVTGSASPPGDTVPMPAGVGGERIVMMPGASVAWAFTVDKNVERELRWAFSSGINSNITLIDGVVFTWASGYSQTYPGVTMTVDGNWRVFKMRFTSTRAAYTGTTSVSDATQMIGPSLHVVSGGVTAGGTKLATAADIPAPTPAVAPPDPRWFSAERDYGKAYSRRTKTGTQAQSISFDFMAAGSGNVPVSINLPTTGAPISGWPISGFWGIGALFINITPPGGSAMTIYVGASIDGVVEIGVGPTAGNVSLAIGRVRNVVIDGIVADRLT